MEDGDVYYFRTFSLQLAQPKFDTSETELQQQTIDLTNKEPFINLQQTSKLDYVEFDAHLKPKLFYSVVNRGLGPVRQMAFSQIFTAFLLESMPFHKFLVDPSSILMRISSSSFILIQMGVLFVSIHRVH